MISLKKIFLVSLFLLLPVVVAAQNQGGNSLPNQGGTSAPNQGGNSVTRLTNPLAAETICGALKLFLTVLLTLAIPVAVLFIVYAGFLFIWARGDPKGLQKARANLFYVVLGVGIFVGAWLLGQVVANTLNALAQGAGSPNPQIGQCK
ncbi:MAG: hypothetical protein WCK46_02575 [Candidatus Adlerbacteria bacterium]